MSIIAEARYPVQTFSIRPAEGAMRLIGAWEVVDHNGNWVGYRRTFCEASNWVREVCGLVEAPALPDWGGNNSNRFEACA